jgi:hypothetical protein
MIGIVKENIVEKPILFFLNASDRDKCKEEYVFDSFDSFVTAASFWTTWIAGFGIWAEDFLMIEDKFAGCELSLWQTKILFEICTKKKEYLISNIKYFDVQNLEKKNLTYGLYKVFYENYLNLYQQYLIHHQISKETFLFLKKHLLFGFFLPWIINIRYNSENYELPQNENTVLAILKVYHNERYYMLFLFKLKLGILKRIVRNIIKEGIYLRGSRNQCFFTYHLKKLIFYK